MKARGGGGASSKAASSMSFNDASPPFVDDSDYGNDDDYNEKQWKLRRSNRTWATKALAIMLLMAVTVLSLSQSYREQQQQQQQQKEVLSEAVTLVMPDAGQQQQQQQQQSDDDYAATDAKLAQTVKDLDRETRLLKKRENVFLETDPQGKVVTKMLQDATLSLLQHRYGVHHQRFRVKVEVTYPESIPGYNELSDNKGGEIVIEMAPINLIPCSVFYFLELARTYQSGSFHRNAGHVLQASAKSTAVKQSMPFQEYDPNFPHQKYTAGYAGRPSGPGWYISIQDNTKNHGPGSQQKNNPYEADSLFGTVVIGVENGVVDKIHSVPQKEWLDKENCSTITKMTILVPQERMGGVDDSTTTIWVPWTPPVPDIEYVPVLL